VKYEALTDTTEHSGNSCMAKLGVLWTTAQFIIETGLRVGSAIEKKKMLLAWILCKINMIPIFMHQMCISTNQVSNGTQTEKVRNPKKTFSYLFLLLCLDWDSYFPV
jgi:hypothetical protein